MARLNKLDHASIPVGDLDEAIIFYRDVLGLEPISRPNFDFPGAWFDGGGTPIHLTTGAHLRGEEFPLRENEAHLAFTTDDPDGFLADLAALNIEIYELPDSPAADRQLFFFDPWRNMLELAVY
jgi:glyoxylase I family protein